MIFIFRCDFLFRPYPAVLKHTDVFPFQNSHHVLIQTESTPVIFYPRFPDFRTGKKEVRTMLMDQPEHFSGDSRALRAAPCRANNWLVVFSTSKHLRCQLHRWLRALNAHIWLLQLEVSLLLKPAVAYSHSLVCLPIQNHNADWFIVGAIRRNLCGHVDGGKPLCLKCLEL